MGEVYRAIDTRLGRKVAIKTLHQKFSDRFEREARAISALNHPHICTLYDVGPNYLVMELLEGETLAAKLKKGKLSIDDALRYGGQIADALAAAHAKGIVHRDLKPGNIMVTKSGVKVLDFGLAKSPGDGTLTGANAVMGSPAYMAPEQREGKECDARTDVYTLGLVLREMVPDPPPHLAHVISRCLESEPENRWQSASDVKRELEWAGKTQLTTQATESRKGLPRWIWGIAVGALGLGLGLGWTLAHLRQPFAGTHIFEQPLVRLDVELEPGVPHGSQGGADAILSPDGTRLVYVSQARLFTRRLDQAKTTELAGTEGGYDPFFSPDGQWVAFFAQGKLKKISVEGGAAIALCEAPHPRGGSWGEDGNIIATLSNTAGLWRIPAAGGPPTPVTELAQGELTHRWPQILPGGKALLFTSNSMNGGYDGANIEVMSLGDRRRKILQRGGTFGRYLPSGHLIYVNSATLFAVPFDLERLEVRGTPAQVLEKIAYSPGTGTAQLDFSQKGTLVYRSGGAEEDAASATVQWLDGTGKTQPLLAKPDGYGYPRLSPDGQRLAVFCCSGDIWIYEWQRDTMTRLTLSGAFAPVWSPDGRYIVFRAPGGIFWTRSDGAGRPQSLTQSKNLQVPYSFTPDGKRLVFQELNATTGFHLWTVPVESDSSGLQGGKPELFLQTQFNERSPVFSPDGRWLAYSSDESGTYQVYVRAFPGAPSGPGGKWQVSNGGGLQPEWSRNGRELFFRTEDRRIMVASYTVKGDSFVADRPRVWSEKPLANVGGMTSYDVARDGKRIAAIMPAEGPEDQKAQDHVIFLQNFFDEVRRRTTAGSK
jgi:serine/threonine-protein kinase